MKMEFSAVDSNTKKQSSLLSVLAIIAIFVALLSFLLPFISVNFFGTQTFSGIEVIAESIDDEEMPAMLSALCPILCVVGLIDLFATMKKNASPVAAIVVLGISMVVMIIAMADDDWDIITALDYAGVGFYLFEFMNFAAIVFSALSIYMSQKAALTFEGKLVEETVDTPDIICPYCGSAIPEKTAYCPLCGKPQTLISEKTETVSIRVCPSCRANVKGNAAFCPFCGKPMNAIGETKIVPIKRIETSYVGDESVRVEESHENDAKKQNSGFSRADDLE